MWCHCWVPICVSYLPSIFRATNFTQTPMKTTMNVILSFLQTLHCSLLYIDKTKIVFLLSGVYAGIIWRMSTFCVIFKMENEIKPFVLECLLGIA